MVNIGDSGTTRAAILVMAAISTLAGCASTTESAPKQTRTELVRERLGAPETPESRLCTKLASSVAYPEYPLTLRQRGIAGWVALSYDLDGSGKATNVKVTGSKPKGAFETVSLQALEKTTFSIGVVRQGCEHVNMFYTRQ